MNRAADSGKEPLPAHGLSPAAMETLRGILRPYAGVIERVGLFGSRATGRWRPASDIDLVLFGPISEAEVDRLWTLFSESSLPVTVDVVAYDHITHPPLKAHVDRVLRPLFEREDLAG